MGVDGEGVGLGLAAHGGEREHTPGAKALAFMLVG